MNVATVLEYKISLLPSVEGKVGVEIVFVLNQHKVPRIKVRLSDPINFRLKDKITHFCDFSIVSF